MTVSAISDRLQHRFAFTMLGTTIGIIGFAILFNVHNNTNTQYAALFLAATGTYTAMPLALCWFGMNGTSYVWFVASILTMRAVQGHAQRSLATGFQIGFGNSKQKPSRYLIMHLTVVLRWRHNCFLLFLGKSSSKISDGLHHMHFFRMPLRACYLLIQSGYKGGEG